MPDYLGDPTLYRLDPAAPLLDELDAALATHPRRDPVGAIFLAPDHLRALAHLATDSRVGEADGLRTVRGIAVHGVAYLPPALAALARPHIWATRPTGGLDAAARERLADLDAALLRHGRLAAADTRWLLALVLGLDAAADAAQRAATAPADADGELRAAATCAYLRTRLAGAEAEIVALHAQLAMYLSIAAPE